MRYLATQELDHNSHLSVENPLPIQLVMFHMDKGGLMNKGDTARLRDVWDGQWWHGLERWCNKGGTVRLRHGGVA